MKQKSVLIMKLKDSEQFYRKNNSFFKLMFANSISRFGDSIDMVAFAWLTYQITNSETWSAIVVGVNQLVTILCQPIVGSIVENINKKKVVVIADFSRFAVIGIFVFLYRIGVTNPVILVCFTVTVSFIETFRVPAGVAIIPILLEKEDYDRGIAANNTISKTFELIGLVSVASLIACLGADGVIFIDAITFLISGVIIITIRYNESKILERAKENYLRMTLDGVRFLKKQKKLLLICLICALINACVIPFDSLQASYITHYFEGKVEILSAISITISVGMIIGAAIYRFIAPKYSELTILTMGGGGIGIFYAICSLIIKINRGEYTMVTRVAILLISSLLVGISLASMNNCVQIFFIKEIKQEFLARISSISTTVTTAFSPLAAFGIGWLASIFDTSTVLAICAGVIIVSFLGLGYRMKRLSKEERQEAK